MKNAFLISATALTIALAATSPSLAMGGRMGGGMFNPDDFAAIDTDQDGKLSKAELEAHRAARFAEADANSDGKLSAEELTAHHAKMSAERGGKGAEKMIDHLDEDGDGALSLAEMSDARRGEKMFSRVDTDEDGMLSAEEVAAARERMEKRGHGKGKDHGCADE